MFAPSSKQHTGFTLVEIIVSLAIFSIVAVIAVGALVRIIGANKKAQSIQDAVNSLNFALESMSREIRTGTDIHCDNSSGVGLTSFSTSPAACVNGRLVAFYSPVPLNDSGGVFQCYPVHAYRFYTPPGSTVVTLQKAVQTCNPNPVPLLDTDFHDLVPTSNVALTDYFLGMQYDAAHPFALVTIRLVGQAGISNKSQTNFDIQTSVSARAQYP